VNIDCCFPHRGAGGRFLSGGGGSRLCRFIFKFIKSWTYE